MFNLSLILAGLVAGLAYLGMLPMRAVRNRLGTLLAADATTLAPASDANVVAVITATFTLGDNLVVGDLTLATDHGLEPIACATGAQLVALDPQSGAQIITLKAGAVPGFRWVSSGVFPPTITVYGFALLNEALDTLLGVMELAEPIQITAAGQLLDGNDQTMTFVQQPLS